MMFQIIELGGDCLVNKLSLATSGFLNFILDHRIYAIENPRNSMKMIGLQGGDIFFDKLKWVTAVEATFDSVNEAIGEQDLFEGVG